MLSKKKKKPLARSLPVKNAEIEEQLDEMWQQHDWLFIVSSKLYHDRSDKEKSWGEIASVLNVTLPGDYRKLIGLQM